MSAERGTRSAECATAKSPIGYTIITTESADGWSLTVLAAMPHGAPEALVKVDNDYTRRTYTSATDAATGARHAINRFNPPSLGLKKGRA